MTAAKASGLLLSFAWAVPLSREQANVVFAGGIKRGSLKRFDGAFGDDWDSAEDFLAAYTERPVRCLLAGDPFAIGIHGMTIPCQLLVSWHPTYHSMTFIAAATIVHPDSSSLAAEVDLTIAVLHSLQGRQSEGEDSLHGSYRGERHASAKEAVTRAFTELVHGCDIIGGLRRKGWCVELRSYDGQPPREAVNADARPFYGLATGDEGWRFVSPEVALTALGPPWGTRTFVAAYAMATGILCLNNKGAEYAEHQSELAVTHFGKSEPYFGLDAVIAGLDHGMLFILERVLIRMALAEQWLHLAHRGTAEPTNGQKSVSQKRLLRGSLDDVLEMLNSVLPPEIDSLERRMVENMGVERVIGQLDRQAQAMDEETRYSYESVVSARITRLTVVTVILTVVTITLGIVEVLVSL